MSLYDLGWNSSWESRFAQLPPAPSWQPARVLRQDRGFYLVATARGSFAVSPGGRFLHRAQDPRDLPAVGDWVACTLPEGEGPGQLQAVLPRQSQFVRKEAGERSAAQVVAANIDTVFLVTGLDQNFNLRRIERYLAVAATSGAEPVIVLNKADLCDSLEDSLAAVEAVAEGAPVIALSALTSDGLDELELFLRPTRTAALLGSSGVGKSTLLNALLGDGRQAVQENRGADGRGRHTTTARELFVLPGGALLIDTPGMRELGLAEVGHARAPGFPSIERLAARCRFKDCRHGQEPDCAVQAALDAGELDPDHFASWQRLQREQAYAARQQDVHLQRAEARRWKQISQRARQQLRFRQERGES